MPRAARGTKGAEFCEWCQQTLPYHGAPAMRHRRSCEKNARNSLAKGFHRISGKQTHHQKKQKKSIRNMRQLEASGGDTVDICDVEMLDASPQDDFGRGEHGNDWLEMMHDFDISRLLSSISPETSFDTPSQFIRIEHHPHSGLKNPTIVPLDGTKLPDVLTTANHFTAQVYEPSSRPWAPFKSRADFIFAFEAITNRDSAETVNKRLKNIREEYCEDDACKIEFMGYKDVKDALKAARECTVKFKTTTITAPFKGKQHEFEVKYREPMDWIWELVKDPTLQSEIQYYPYRKFLHDMGLNDRLYDEPASGDAWWEIQNSLPQDGQVPHVFVPLAYWLDKGLVTKRIKMHPMVLRCAMLPSGIRNASGNGGGMFLGFMPIPSDPSELMEKSEADTVSSEDFLHYKRKLYQKTEKVIFCETCKAARYGIYIRCGDGVDRIFHPGIHIAELDMEEAYSFCTCRAASSNHPCPRCLIHHDDLDDFDSHITLRTSELMRIVYKNAQKAKTKKERHKILTEYGINDVKNFFWKFQYSDPYSAYSYDSLHSDDLGKFGKHLFPHTLEVLSNLKSKRQLSSNMAKTQPWPGLKHFNDVAAMEFTDGQAFFDIEKQILPSLVQLLRANSPLIHCIRAHAQYRMTIDMKCNSERRLTKLKEYIEEYGRAAIAVSRETGKNFKFPKHHATLHVAQDIRRKGATKNFSTRPGEGFQQEVFQAYHQTNFKNVEAQITTIDENMESMAQIMMAVNNYDNHLSQLLVELKKLLLDDPPDENDNTDLDTVSTDAPHCIFGAPLSGLANSWQLEKSVPNTLESDKRWFANFDKRLRQFIRKELNIPLEDSIPIKIKQYKCMYITYQSLDDWSLHQ